jgi:hypothetical protein
VGSHIIDPLDVDPAKIVAIVARFLNTDNLLAPVAQATEWGCRYALLGPRLD